MKYIAPEMELKLLESQDVITTSNTQGGGNSGGNTGTEMPDDDF